MRFCSFIHAEIRTLQKALANVDIEIINRHLSDKVH